MTLFFFKPSCGRKPNFSQHNVQADQMGMNLLLKLCIHPDVAVSVWETMEERGVGNTGIGELLSTHPNSSSRRKKLQNLVPKLESEYDIRCGSIKDDFQSAVNALIASSSSKEDSGEFEYIV